MKQKHPSREECLLLLKQYETPEHVIRHCMAVTAAALCIARTLNTKGFTFDLDLIQGAGLIHDIARTQDKHWDVGAAIALDHGYVQEAEIIQKHMMHSFDPDPQHLTELDMVCLGDRLILEDKYVGLDVRMQYIINKTKGNKEIERIILERKEVTRALLQSIEQIAEKTVNQLVLEDGKEDNWD